METPPLPPAQTGETTKPSRTKLWIGGAAATALTLGIAVPVMADSGANEPRLAEPATSTVVLEADEMGDLAELDDAELDGMAIELGPEELTDEDIAEINAETDAIVAYLADNGVTVEVETDEDGIRWPVIDDEDDATWELVDQWYVDTYGDDFEMLEGCDFDEDHDFGDLDDEDADELGEDDLDGDDDMDEDLEDEGEA